ncbi:MAG TPA: MbcA/ParS/Xre antitoxin family protein [Candidatus Acidoferrales bacterium]|jgi:putative toxin-antitoxin system antitoxin component (TIGR02293 family)|nr:MbcA/ParS/Xre antitoxin family protein [Candidatus Acidoferrales bacterium]
MSDIASTRPDESEIPEPDEPRLRILFVTARAGEVFANRQKALRWLQSPNPALGGSSPLAAAETDAGYHEVEDILGRIEYGVLG